MTCGIIGLFMTPAFGIIGALVGAAPPPGHVARIGMLGAGFPAPPQARLAFLQALRELGWEEGQNLVVERRWAEGHTDRLPALAAELVGLPVDVLVTVENAATAAARQTTGTTPTVMVSGGDPVGLGFIASLARPGGNITGTAWTHPEIPGKLLELLTEAVPQARRVAVLANPALLSVHTYEQANVAASRALAVALQAVEVRQPDEVEAALAQLAHERPDALYVVGDPVVATRQPQILAFAAQHRVPAIYTARAFVDAGGLMYYGPSRREILQRTASFVDKLLKGANPADLPVEQPTTFELVINLKTAQALGLTIPPSLLVQATEVIR